MPFHHKIVCYPVLFFLFLMGKSLNAQQPVPVSVSGVPQQDTTKKIVVEYSELGEFFNRSGREFQKLSDNVRLRHETTVVYCDSALISGDDAVLTGSVLFVQTDSTGAFADSVVYNAATKVADMYGNVALENGAQTLFTTRLNYDMAQKLATYHNGATLTNGKTLVNSQHGYYYTEEKKVFFKGDVQVTDPEFSLKTDTLLYETELKRVVFLAPTIITQPDTKIYTEAGYYDLANGVAEFENKPQFIRNNQKGTADRMRYFEAENALELYGNARIEEEGKLTVADTILYNGLTGIAYLLGNAAYTEGTQRIESPRIEYDTRKKQYNIQGRSRIADGSNVLDADNIGFNEEFGSGTASGNVVWVDTSNQTTIQCQNLDYNKNTGFLQANGGAFGSTRPLMTSLLDGDTLFLSADTLTSFRPDEKVDSIRVLLAHRDVRIFKSDLQAVCDSLSYSSLDSIFHFYAFKPDKKPPVLWADSSQFTADTIRIALRNQALDRIFLEKNAMTLQTEDGYMFNQIKGRSSTAFFSEGKIAKMLTEGNAQAVYYATDEQERYIGVNETSCSRMLIEFAENQVSGIRFYAEPTGTFTPLTPNSDPIKLEGFFWDAKRKPTRLTVDGFLEEL